MKSDYDIIESAHAYRGRGMATADELEAYRVGYRLAESESQQEIERLKLDIDILKSAIAINYSPCGHSDKYLYTDNGGKNILCLLCAKDNRDKEIERLKAELEVTKRNEKHAMDSWEKECVEGIRLLNIESSKLQSEKSKRVKMVEELKGLPFDWFGSDEFGQSYIAHSFVQSIIKKYGE